MARSIITLTTDFGLSDHFVAVMKGVILGIHPAAHIVDITHDVGAFEIAEAAFVVAEASRWFPRGTVHVVVVDPGVGTARRPILAQAEGQIYLAPDNGVLSMVYARGPHKVRTLTAEKLFLDPVSATFHGRDIFAPVAARLAQGLAPARCGKLVKDYLRQEFHRPVRTSRRAWTGAVLKIDRFGNLITNFHIQEFPALASRPFRLAIGALQITELAATFAQGPPGEPVLLVGSSGYLEVAVNQASAANLLGVASGAPAELTLW
ncbi:MAG: SAM-dependent chlorinase/fluorinase [Acidobacteria bacterium]|nr:SAM-dependent chlorinase/fluorinase [Acidobacteriota bacterium]